MNRVLSGRTVLVTRPAHQAAELAGMIEARGGVAYGFPALEVAAVHTDRLAAALAQLPDYDSLIFISPNAARLGMAAIRGVGKTLPTIQMLAVGSGTAQALVPFGVKAIEPAGQQDSEALLALPQLQNVAGKHIGIVRGIGGRTLLGDTLVARGAKVTYLECYRRARPQVDAAPLLMCWQAGGIDAVTVTSAETLHNLAALLGEVGLPLLQHTPIFAPHEKIADAALRFGVAQVIATPGGDAGLVEGLVNWFKHQRGRTHHE
ncbi:MAG: uroporphyrinogen-III synthase [Thiobacillus sp.]